MASVSDNTEQATAGDATAIAAENAELRDQLLRALADAENTRRQAARRAQDIQHYAITEFAREMLPVADNLQRTVAGAEGSAQKAENTALLEGVRATQRVLMNALERFGIRRLDAQGAPFDPMQHEALLQVDDPAVPPGSVRDVMEDGYTIHDRLLRPARVVVNKTAPQASPRHSSGS
jgi:molecular chaperone GrpE